METHAYVDVISHRVHTGLALSDTHVSIGDKKCRDV